MCYQLAKQNAKFNQVRIAREARRVSTRSWILAVLPNEASKDGGGNEGQEHEVHLQHNPSGFCAPSQDKGLESALSA